MKSMLRRALDWLLGVPPDEPLPKLLNGRTQLLPVWILLTHIDDPEGSLYVQVHSAHYDRQAAVAAKRWALLTLGRENPRCDVDARMVETHMEVGNV